MHRGPGDPEEDVIHAVLDKTFWRRFHELLRNLMKHQPSKSQEQTAMWMLDARQQILQAVNRTGDAI